MAQSYIDPAQAVLSANEYGEALVRRASEGDRSTGAEVDAIMGNPSHPYYSAVSSRLGKFMAQAFGWPPEPR